MKQQFFCIILALLMTSAHAVPVIPGAAGFGMDTPAGRGGKVYRVTNLNASGSASLAECVAATVPRVCIFEVSGTIRLSGHLTIRSPNITIAGQTAPSPGIMLRGGGFAVRASDVLIQHLRIRVGDDPPGIPYDIRNALVVDASLEAPIKNIVIDHCSLSWGTDQTMAVYWNWDNVTFRNTIFGEALNDSYHSKGLHGFGPLIELVNATHAARMAMIGNLFAHQMDRNPLSRAPRFVFVNNVVYNRMNRDVDLQSRGMTTYNTIVGNVFVRGPNYNSTAKPIVVGGYGFYLPLDSQVYLSDNAAQEATSDPWSLASVSGGSISDYKVTTIPTWPTGLIALPSSQALDYVLRNVGSRPADRDSVDERLIQDIKDRKGQIINCVSADGSTRCQKNAGGWPILAHVQRLLSLPDNPNTLESDGYTRLEKWLHGMAAQVEGRISVVPEPPSNISVQ